jgi:hypothetical protein
VCDRSIILPEAAPVLLRHQLYSTPTAASFLLLVSVCLEWGVLPDQFALFLTDFLNDIRPLGFLCVIKDIKLNRVAFSLRLSQETILAFRAGLDSNIVGRNSLQHILAFSYVNDLIVQLDAVNAGMLVFGG